MLVDVIFQSNAATQGGGIYNQNSSPVMINTTFNGNRATWFNYNRGGGGAMFNIASNPTLSNVIFSGNAVTSSRYNQGGAIVNYSSSPTLTNVTFSANAASVGSAIYSSESSHPAVQNSIVWGNGGGATSQIQMDLSSTTVMSYSIVQGGYPGAGNLDADPRFVDTNGGDDTPGSVDDNVRLQAGSPAIDAADNETVPLDAGDLDGDGNTIERMPLDADRNPRFVDDIGTGDKGNGVAPIIDIGAYEYQFNTPGTAEILILGGDGKPLPSGSTIDLGSGRIGEAIETKLSIFETGTARLDVTAPEDGALSGIDASDFSLPNAVLPFSIADGGVSKTLTIRCTPSTEGRRDATLTLQTNASTTSLVSYHVECLGVTIAEPATLTINYTTGRPGSWFTVHGSRLPAQSRVALLVNDILLNDTAVTDADGNITFLLDTSYVPTRSYTVTVKYRQDTTPVERKVYFLLEANSPFRSKEAVEAGTVIALGTPPSANRSTYLPVVVR
jgi:hypothetical protein